jgi:hypothetical protein
MCMFEVRRNGDASQDRPDRCEERAECFACVAFEEYNFGRFNSVGVIESPRTENVVVVLPLLALNDHALRGCYNVFV